MQLVAVMLARIVAFVELLELDPHGHLHAPDFFKAAAKQFSFQKFPEKYEQFDLQKGVELALGRSGKISIEKLMAFTGGISLDTRSSTEDSSNVLDEFLTWAASNYELRYHPDMIKRKGYVSQIIFTAEIPILMRLSDPVAKLSTRVTTALESAGGERIVYEPTSISIGFDSLTRKLTPAAFTIQRRVDVPFNMNRYFSEAPLPTGVHLQLLQEFETELQAPQK